MSLALLAKIANSVGLVLGISGTVMLWRYGLPAEVRRHGRSFFAVGGPNSEEVEKAKRYDRRARMAISAGHELRTSIFRESVCLLRVVITVHKAEASEGRDGHNDVTEMAQCPT